MLHICLKQKIHKSHRDANFQDMRVAFSGWFVYARKFHPEIWIRKATAASDGLTTDTHSKGKHEQITDLGALNVTVRPIQFLRNYYVIFALQSILPNSPSIELAPKISPYSVLSLTGLWLVLWNRLTNPKTVFVHLYVYWETGCSSPILPHTWQKTKRVNGKKYEQDA